MPITRRQFALASTSLVALNVLGCESLFWPAGTKAKPPLPAGPYFVGDPAQYRTPGLYGKFNDSDRVWLVSDGHSLIALADFCTHLGCGLNEDAANQLLKCPCHGSIYTLDGVPKPGSKAKRPLDRFALAILQTPDGPQVQIDPTKRFRQEAPPHPDPATALALPTT